MKPPNPPDPCDTALSRRAVLGAAFGGVALLGLSACASGSPGSGEAADDRAAGDSDPGVRALAGVPVEVWRDPG